MVVQELPRNTVQLIKSTQVITTPVSVVKELLENSLDAAASAVSIRLENHGFTLMEVRDNGCGIEEGDMKFIAKPHFTSKISAFEDLASLSTYGFRGEALSSLCTVAEVSITTKTKDSVMAHTYTFDHSGNVASMKPAAAPNGTAVAARNLFKNVPVRKHYYGSAKKRKEELKKVEELLLAFTLAAPGVHLTLSHDKCTIMQKSPVNNIKEVLISTFPAIHKDLVFKERSTGDIRIEAYLPGLGPCNNPGLSRTTPDRFFILVNQRPVLHKSIEKVVKAFYSQKTQGSHGRYPMGVVTLSVPLASVDINLEPNKTRMFLSNEDQVLETLQDILSELYGPLDLAKKHNDEDASGTSHKGDIACTYGGLKEDSERPEEENINGAQNVEEDNFSDVRNKKNVSVCDGRIQAMIGQATVRGVGRVRTAFALTRDSESRDSVRESNTFKDTSQVRQVNQEQEKSEKAASNSVQLDVNDNNSQEELCHGNNKARCASTPNDSSDACFPSISACSMIQDDEFDELLSECDSLVAQNSECGVSGVAPLSLSSTNVLRESGAKENYQPAGQHHKDALHGSNCDESKLHESFTGSDGVPVYKIPALPPFDKDENEHRKDDSEELTQQRKDTSSKELSEHTSPSSADSRDIQNTEPRGLEDRGASTGGVWSRGMPIHGKDIQTVQVVSAAALRSKPASESASVVDSARELKRQVLQEADGQSSTPPKKAKINSLSPARHSYVCGNPVKKPSSAFILFSRDIRRQVLSEHPGADFAFLAKQIADRWKALDTDAKNHYKELANAEAERYQMEVNRIKERRAAIGGSPLASGYKTAASLDRYVAPLTPYLRVKKRENVVQAKSRVADRPSLQHSKDIKCSLDDIKRKLRKRHPVKKNSDALTIVGQVTSTGGWVGMQGSSIVAVNVYRVFEVVLVENLMRTYRFTVKHLDDPILFNASNVGMENWAALLRLPRELVPDRNFYHVTDERLIANGFHIALFPGTTTSVAISHGEITKMADTVGFYGIIDLKDILSHLAASPLASLQQTRPLKLQQWIKGEAVRMIRSAPNIVRQDDVLDKVRRLHMMHNGAEMNKLTCIHGRPVFTKLYSLEDLPCSRQKDTKVLSKEAFARNSSFFLYPLSPIPKSPKTFHHQLFHPSIAPSPCIKSFAPPLSVTGTAASIPYFHHGDNTASGSPASPRVI